MDINDKSKEIDIKNGTCFFFDDTMRVVDIDLYKMLLDEKSYESILIYDISWNKWCNLWLD